MSLITSVRSQFSELLNDPAINSFVPRSLDLRELCEAWAMAVRCEDDLVGSAPRRDETPARHGREVYSPYSMTDVRQAEAQKLFTAVSTFSGAGGSALGYALAGGDVRGAVEFGPVPVLAYRLNNPGRLVEQRNIRDILADPSGVENFLAKAGLKVGQVDIVDSSPPCTEFSKAGSGIQSQSSYKVHSGIKQTNVATLPFAYAEFLHRVRPKTSIMENVVGLASTYPRLLNKILDALRYRNGRRAYFVNWQVLSAANYGVGQYRERVIIISVRAEDVAPTVGIRSDYDVLKVFPTPTHGIVSIRSALEGLQQTEDDIAPYRNSLRLSPILGLLRQLPPGPLTSQRLRNVTSNFTLVRCAWDFPAPTLVITGQKPDRLTGAIHPQHDRKFTIPELKRLFGLPDDFILTGTIEQAVECICNMVPPFLTRAIAHSLYDKVIGPLNATQ